MKRFFIVFTFLLLAITLPAQIFIEDTIRACHTDSLMLDAGTGYDSYRWSTGETTPQIYVKRTDTYSLTALSGAVETRDSVYVNLIRAAIVENDTIICFGDELALSLRNLEPKCLSGLYPLNGNGDDISGNGNHGLPIDLVPFSNRYNENGMASFFNPVSKSRVMIPRTPELELTSRFTISAWIAPGEGWGSGASDGEYYILNKWRTILPDECAFILGVKNDGMLFFRTTDGNEYSEISAPVPLSVDKWVHVVVVMNEGILTLYLGDVTGIEPVAEITNAVIPNETPTDIYLGAAVITNDHNYKGALDDIRFYQCVLSEYDITVLNRRNMTYDYTIVWSDGSSDTFLLVTPEVPEWYFVDIDDGVNHCTDSVYIDVYPEIKITLEQIGKGCPGSVVGALHAQVTGGIPFDVGTSGQPRSPYRYTWSPVVFNYDSIALRLSEGDYSVTITDSVGCALKGTATVETYEAPGVEIEADPTSIYFQNPRVQFSATSDYAISYSWDFGDTTYSTLQNPEHLYSKLDMKQTAYEAWAFVEDVNGCRDSASITLDVKEVKLNFPNVFTPNGDGVNEYFEVEVEEEEGKSITDVYLSSTMVIYNRWGEKVFEDNNFSGQPGSSWDGQNHKDGVYHYILRCRGFFKEDVYRGVIHILTQPPKDPE
ncbi:MAG: gliding motility-associated C-terminal domain-containing protein [Bacteroidales bacterium]|nr:gliding motility-associated C-terminal domain-containing protein [Bacteroidales bacterium]MDD3010059.1 gliding motility-associated C-terminal domain-containing protein [Bacteroidales bacterium]MDY0285252.1 LamG-like jellyroll fold domain-containing protein [Bacteroidales bacterium]